MIREASTGDGAATVAEAVVRLAEAIGSGRAWMTAEKAADFLRLNHSEFKRLTAAGELPRRTTTPSRYRYYAPELTDWLLPR